MEKEESTGKLLRLLCTYYILIKHILLHKYIYYIYIYILKPIITGIMKEKNLYVFMHNIPVYDFYLLLFQTSASESDDTTPKESPRVEELDENDVSTTESSKNSDSVLDDIVDNIDITTLLSKDELAAKEEASKRVLSASKDYNPVEREKAKAKRKALEQEIVRQTEEFDRLAEIQRNKKKSSSTVDGTQVKDKDSSSSRSVVQKEASASVKKRRVKLSKSEWVKIIRCALLVILGGCVGNFQNKIAHYNTSFVSHPLYHITLHHPYYNAYAIYTMICYVLLCFMLWSAY